MAPDYKIKMRPIFKQSLPKKTFVSKRLKVSGSYECTVGLWVPDTPYSKVAPGIAFTLKHGNKNGAEYFRLIFKEMTELQIFLDSLNGFIAANLKIVDECHKQALGDWIEAQAKRQNPEVDERIDQAKKLLS